MNVLIVSQVIPQWYVDVLKKALPDNTNIDIITGSNVDANVIPSPKHNATSFASRLLCWYKHWRFMGKWIKENKNKSYDLIFAVSNPPINSYIGLKLKKTFNAPFIFMNWDIYPQFIDYMIKNPVVHFVCTLWHKWNDKNYKKIDKILTIGDIVAESINDGLKNKIDVSVIPIGVDTNRLNPIDKSENVFCKENGLSNKFVVLYSGKMGYGHNIELIIKGAQRLKEYKDIVFVFIGDGQKFELVKKASEVCENIKVYPMQSEEMFPYSMASGDVGIVAEEEKMAHLFMPSKTYSMMACGMPIIGICSDNDDLHNLINNEGIGYTVIDNDADKFCECILTLYNDKELHNDMKNRSRYIAQKEYDISAVTEKYRDLFKKYI